MFKYKYVISYNVRPNKKTLGSPCAMSITTSRSLDKDDEQRKVLLMLSRSHRVNLDAIELHRYILMGREFAPSLLVGLLKAKLKSVVQTIVLKWSRVR